MKYVVLLVLNLGGVLLLLNCSGSKHITDSKQNLERPPCSITILERHTYYPEHLAYEIVSQAPPGCALCRFGGSNDFEMTVLSETLCTVFSRPQGICKGYMMILEPGQRYLYPVLPQEYLQGMDAKSGYYYLFGAYTDMHGSRLTCTDTVRFYYDSTKSYRYMYKKDWSKEITIQTRKTQENLVLFVVNNKSSDTLKMETDLLLEASPKRGDLPLDEVPRYNLSDFLVGKMIPTMLSDSILISCRDLQERIGLSEFYTLLMTFTEDSQVSALNLIFCE